MMTVRGRFTDVAISGKIDPDHPAASSIEVTINVASLTTNNAERDNHLRSSDFLQVDKHPTITFRSMQIETSGQGKLRLTGDLTIKGITRPITLRVRRYGEMDDKMMGHRIAYSAERPINRKDFGLDFDMVADSKLVVSNEVKILIELELVEVAVQAALAAA